MEKYLGNIHTRDKNVVDTINEHSVDELTEPYIMDKQSAPLNESSQIFKSSLYELMHFDEQTSGLVMRCTSCFKRIRGNSCSTGNFFSHIKVSTYILQ